jgi:hypothetical protein
MYMQKRDKHYISVQYQLYAKSLQADLSIFYKMNIAFQSNRIILYGKVMYQFSII